MWQVDWERNAKGSLTLEFEVGRSVVGRWGVFVWPGIGVFGRGLLGAYDWNVEAGMRYMFTSFYRSVDARRAAATVDGLRDGGWSVHRPVSRMFAPQAARSVAPGARIDSLFPSAPGDNR